MVQMLIYNCLYGIGLTYKLRGFKKIISTVWSSLKIFARELPLLTTDWTGIKKI